MGESLYEAIGQVKIPRMVRIRQHFEDNRIEDPVSVVEEQMERSEILETIKPGMRIAITASSRPIHNLDIILRTIVRILRRHGAEPFVIPAMGSHGGGTAEGQKHILNSYGITEERVGCPILSSMETVSVGTSPEGHPVHIDALANAAQGIIVVGKIRPHSGFSGPYESGLMKMMTIGLGKQHGAAVCHNAGAKYLAKYIPMFANVILENCNILFGVGIIENAYHKTYLIECIPAKDIPSREPALLQKAYTLLPRLMFKDVAVLVLDEIGKNISGDGMDPYITTRFGTPYVTTEESIQKVAILDISAESHGGMLGAGWADVCTRRMFDKCALEESYVNAITATIFDGVRIPMILKNDYYAIAACIRGSVDIDRENIRLVRMHNTLEAYDIEISESMIEDACRNPDIEILGDLEELEFDENGNLW
ncbi:MAG: hypothetical protein CVV64_20895 [Candidatus Wallbacteria bacterium HGW-Wallbacteria-1]|jgi:hypothetical protein|uniref:LarA-like N-terminal domain-containing protein n=1 Tax=Candidatus Wallbacteria bacterium HGW-Wallbacteria-1 TaxID=2013854 RepID=A0A2N1PI20_9BACT|nr:MAG: hypothetical protein CVV64_20895 [Candidatus Wallbacteria bacterium HGW-Wallbacteria-1]PKL27068.1 MAG: hypothetical protein CVV46_13660 [Spirochaetae bacterium HGW-Spirochaetae-2]